MKFVSPLLKHAVFPGLARLGYLGHGGDADGLAAVTYHGILPSGYREIDPDLDGSLVSVDSFRRQLGLLKKKYNVISPEQFLRWCEDAEKLPPRSVLLTCDDDLRNTLTDMVPVLQEHGMSCLFFVTGASMGEKPAMQWHEQLYLMLLAAEGAITLDLADIGVRIHSATRPQKRALWWNLVRRFSGFDSVRRENLLGQVGEHLGLARDWTTGFLTEPVRRRFLMLSASELPALAAAGMSVGAHTLSHPVLADTSPGLAWTEISECRRNLEQILKTTIWALAYPFGDFVTVTLRDQEMAQRAGFKCAFLNVGGGFGAEMPRFALPRVHVSREMNLGEFEAHVSGFYRRLRRRFLGAA